jgi:hypothetical protein
MSDCCNDNSKNKINKPGAQDLEGLICYCFKKSKKDLYRAVKNGTEANIVDDIKSKMTNPGCFCESANPSGKCCLSDIQSFIKAVKESE